MTKLTVLVGMPGAGKSTWAKTAADNTTRTPAGTTEVVVSTDEIRKELTGDQHNQTKNALVFPRFFKDIEMHLRNGQAVIADSTALDTTTRRELRRIARRNGVQIHAVVFADADQAEERNALRQTPVPPYVMERMRDKLLLTLGMLGREHYDSVRYV